MAEIETKPPAPVVQLDAQDPLPESNWTWRRILVFVGGTIQIGLVAWIIYLIGSLQQAAIRVGSVETLIEIIEALVKIAFWLMILLFVDRILYLVSPSAEQATKMIQTASLFKHGVTLKREQQLRATDTSTTAATSTTVGRIVETPNGSSDSSLSTGADSDVAPIAPGTVDTATGAKPSLPAEPPAVYGLGEEAKSSR